MRLSRFMLAATAAAVLGLPLAAMGNKESAGSAGGSEKPVVVVSILPQAYFVERIAGDRVRPVVLVGPGQSPHAYEPTPRQMADLAAARMWLTIGVEFENALKPKVASLYAGLRVVDTTTGIEYRRLEAHDHEGEGHEEDGDGHEETGLDPHVWLGRQAVKAMAASIRDALTAADPAGAAAYSANHDAFVRDIDATFDGMVKRLASLRGTTAFVYHPAFGYLLDELGIEQEAVETGGKEPTQKNLSDMINEAKADGAKAIFVQAQFPVSAAKVVADAIGGSVISIDPLARDWLSNLGIIAEELRKAAP